MHKQDTNYIHALLTKILETLNAELFNTYHVNVYFPGGMIAGICLSAGVPLVILANLMYLKCVRQR